jgi:hypothetical protein
VWSKTRQIVETLKLAAAVVETARGKAQSLFYFASNFFRPYTQPKFLPSSLRGALVEQGRIREGRRIILRDW